MALPYDQPQPLFILSRTPHDLAQLGSELSALIQHSSWYSLFVASRAFLLAPEGLLILDPTEHLGLAGHFFTRAADGVYSRARASCYIATQMSGLLRQ